MLFKFFSFKQSYFFCSDSEPTSVILQLDCLLYFSAYIMNTNIEASTILRKYEFYFFDTREKY